ncbi:MAG: hypothetical protein AAGD06_14075 [Acidobacteriota bacterium]
MARNRSVFSYARGLSRDIRVLGKNLDMANPWSTFFDFVGPASSWLDHERSELRPPKRLGEVDGFLRSVAHATVPRAFFLRDSPCSLPKVDENDPFPREAWFFVNGIGSDLTLLAKHGDFLEALFGRRCELVYNPTDGLPLDILESVLGHTLDAQERPADYLLERVTDALSDSRLDRVVVVGHSHGAKVVSRMLEQLVPGLQDSAPLRRLEVYTLGAAADAMEVHPTLSRDAGRLVPYVEHYANLDDVIARIGILQGRPKPAETRRAPGRGGDGTTLRGEIYVLPNRGHLLNAHYLPAVGERRFRSDRFGGDSRLYGYLGGATPDYFNTL